MTHPIRLPKLSLCDDCHIFHGTLPDDFVFGSAEFHRLWEMHPDTHSVVTIMGKQIPVPRWDQAYGRDYPFSGQVAFAVRDIPPLLSPFLAWVQQYVEPLANGLFVNWHDGSLGHYHGKHRDSTTGLIHGTPITTISLGEPRIFRMRPYPAAKPAVDFEFANRDVIVVPWDTNKRWYHEVPKSARHKGQRISVTVRAFE